MRPVKVAARSSPGLPARPIVNGASASVRTAARSARNGTGSTSSSAPLTTTKLVPKRNATRTSAACGEQLRAPAGRRALPCQPVDLGGSSRQHRRSVDDLAQPSILDRNERFAIDFGTAGQVPRPASECRRSAPGRSRGALGRSASRADHQPAIAHLGAIREQAILEGDAAHHVSADLARRSAAARTPLLTRTRMRYGICLAPSAALRLR